jgi:hypothetical protein
MYSSSKSLQSDISTGNTHSPLRQDDDVITQFNFRFSIIQNLICNNKIVIYKCSNNIRRCLQSLFGGFSQHSPVRACLSLIIINIDVTWGTAMLVKKINLSNIMFVKWGQTKGQTTTKNLDKNSVSVLRNKSPH